jgi:streptogramin lyase
MDERRPRASAAALGFLACVLLLASCSPAGALPAVTPISSTPSPTAWRAGDLGCGTISGTVTDSSTGDPIPGATVICEHSSYFPQAPCDGRTTTLEDGSFVFENVFFHDTDRIVLAVAADGYVSRSVQSSFFTWAGWLAEVALDPEPSDAFPFRRMTAEQAFPEQARLFDLWVSPQGELRVATDLGLYVQRGSGFEFERDYPETLIQIVGLQEEPPTLWALGADGVTIHARRGDGWTVYGLAQGWQPLPAGVSSNGPAVTPDGAVWLATGADDLRRFDPVSSTWSSLQATDLGFEAASGEYQGHNLSDALVSSTGSLWVSDCLGMGEGFEGQGVRYYSDGAWTPLLAAEGQCVFDLERDPEGRMWVGGTDTILVYDRASGTWAEISPPPWERTQYIVDILFDPAGEPWIGSRLCYGASCDGLAYFSRRNGQWLPVLEASSYFGPAPSIAFGADGAAWICWYGTVYNQADDEFRRYGSLRTERCELAVDGSGTIWVAALDGGQAGLWHVDSGLQMLRVSRR